jgi:hypothetical protein
LRGEYFDLRTSPPAGWQRFLISEVKHDEKIHQSEIISFSEKPPPNPLQRGSCYAYLTSNLKHGAWNPLLSGNSLKPGTLNLELQTPNFEP